MVIRGMVYDCYTNIMADFYNNKLHVIDVCWWLTLDRLNLDVKNDPQGDEKNRKSMVQKVCLLRVGPASA